MCVPRELTGQAPPPPLISTVAVLGPGTWVNPQGTGLAQEDGRQGLTFTWVPGE